MEINGDTIEKLRDRDEISQEMENLLLFMISRITELERKVQQLEHLRRRNR